MTESDEADEPSGLRAWGREAVLAAGALAAGAFLLPGVIFYGGGWLLGRYENASLGALYDSVYAGLRTGSFASWAVVLGPYASWLLFRVLASGWRASAPRLTQRT